MNAREAVLGSSPYGGFVARNRMLPDDDLVQEAFDAVNRTGILSREDARIVAYARYAGIGENVPEELYRRAGLKKILIRELSLNPIRSYLEPERIAAALESTSLMGLVGAIRDTEVGWSLAVIALAHDTAPTAVAGLTPMAEDRARLLPMIALMYAVPPRARTNLLQRLISDNDSLVHACGEVMAYNALRAAVHSGSPIDPVVRGFERAVPQQAVAALGYVLDNLGRWLEYTSFGLVAAKRAEKIWAKLQLLGQHLIKDTVDVELVLSKAGRRELQVLAALSRWEYPESRREEFSAALGKRAERLFWKQFGTRLTEPDNRQIVDAPHPDSVVAALIDALSSTGLSAQQFEKAYNGLAADAFSRMTRNGAWFADRRRAVALIMVGAFVAKNRADQSLKVAVERVAGHAISQPALPTPVFTEDPSELLGFTVPLA